MSKIATCFLVALAPLLWLDVSQAATQPRVQIGLLRCTLLPGIGAIAGSRRRMNCRFTDNTGQRSADYTGTITRFGIDVGVTAGGLMSWRVFSRTRGDPISVIAGHYIGVSADMSLGLGGGAKVLIGGSRRLTMLQPVALVGSMGVNVGAGIAGMTLRRAS